MNLSSGNTRKHSLFFASFVAVVVVYHFCYGLHTLLPGQTAWLMEIKHDWGSHYLGWLFYRNEPWDFPIGQIDNYFYPPGTNIGFTDSIPILAIFFKLFSFALPDDFQYFGLWLLFCHLMTACFTIKICRHFGLHEVYCFLAVILVAANPVLIYRGLHPALCAHWMILASLYWYIRTPSVMHAGKALRYQLILLILASLVNPYICFMILGFSFAIAAKLRFVSRVIGNKGFWMNLGISLLSLFVSGFLLGIFSLGKQENVGVEGGYGLYGLNLHSLYNSFGFSRFFRGIEQVRPHQYEGFMYLGLGMFFILFLTLIVFIYQRFSGSEKVTRSMKARWNPAWLPLMILVILYTVFAISHVVTLDKKILFTVPIPSFIEKLGDIFRASARFFWPVYYLLLLVPLIIIYRVRISLPLKTGLVALAVFLQLYDTTRIFTYRDLAYGNYQPPIDEEKWKSLMAGFENIVFYPPFSTTNKEPMDYQYFCWWAGKMKLPITTGYVARVDENAVRDYNGILRKNLEEGSVSEKSLYITTGEQLAAFAFCLQSGALKLGWLDGYYFLYASRIENNSFDQLVRKINEPNRVKIDSVTEKFGKRTEFSLTDPSVFTNAGIRHNVERISEKENFISVSGWAFLESKTDSRGDTVFIVLRKPGRTYVAGVSPVMRPDITAHFSKTFLDNAGFQGMLFTEKMDPGLYELGILVKESTGTLNYTPTGNKIRVRYSEFTAPQVLNSLPDEGDIAFNAETIKDEGDHFLLQGWAHFRNQDARSSAITLLLKKEMDLFAIVAEPMSRPDIAPYFKSSFNLDNAGYIAKFKKSSIPAGLYQLGILIEDKRSGRKGYVFTGKEIEVDGR